MIEGQVAFTAVSDKTKKENFQPVDGEEVLGKIRGFELSSWNFIGHDPKKFRHYVRLMELTRQRVHSYFEQNTD